MMNYEEEINKMINIDINNIEDENIRVNKGETLFSNSDYKVIEGKPTYFEPDKYGRSSGAIAIVSRNTMPFIIKKKLDYPKPYGWTKNIENQGIFERCHIIAYSLSAKLADKRNIFIGTEHLNTSTMMKVENRIKKHLNNNDVRILYRVTIKYKGKNQIPTGILIEAKSLDDEFSICEFCYNVQKDVTFKYTDGTIIKNTKINKIKQLINKKKSTKKNNKKSNSNNTTNDYIINKQTNEFHLYDNHCDSLNNVESKYIIETTAKEKDLLKIKKLKPCKKCIYNNI